MGNDPYGGLGLRGSLEMFQLKHCGGTGEPEKFENFLNRKSWQIIVILLLCFDT